MIMRENKKPFIITIIILIIIILGLGGYIAYDYLVKDKENEKVITVVNNVSINLNSFYQVSKTLDYFDTAFNNPGSDYYGYIYNSKRLEARKFDSKAAMYAAIADEMIASNTKQTIPSDRVKGNLESMFGDTVKYIPETISLDSTIKVNFDKSVEMFSYTLPTKNTNYKNGYVTENIKTVLENDYIIITRKVFYIEYNDPNNASSATIYTNANKNNKIGTVSVKNGKVNTKELLGKYSSRLATYEYKFIKNSLEDYTFYEINRIK